MDKLKAIQYFLAAAQTGSLSAAARQRGMTLQAVAKLVSALEAELGFKLFQRGSRGLQLTTDGAQYAEACARCWRSCKRRRKACDSRGSARKVTWS